jgi:hypothetical protein
MRRHNCVEQTGDICPRCESAAEERAYGIERDTGSSDREADRYQRWMDDQW